MPNKREHSLATLTGAASTSVVMTGFGFPASETLSMLLGFLITLFINPDLDLNSRFPKGQPHKWPWWVLWFPYSRLIAHRSLISHFPIVGTLTRIGYLSTFLIVIIIIVQAQNINVPDSAIYVIAGMCLSDALHFVLDAL